MKHPLKVEGYSQSLKQLAEEIANMRYDQVVVFLDSLANDLNRQAEGDKKRSRLKLSAQLSKAAASVEEARLCIEEAWIISKPFMKE